MRFSTFVSTAMFATGAQAASSSSLSPSPSASPSPYTPYINFNTVAYITETVSAYTTYISAATQLALKDTRYTISEPTTLTLSSGGPFTLVRPLIAQTIVAGCATCYATALFSTMSPTTSDALAFPTPLPSIDANGTTVGSPSLKTTATAFHTAASSNKSKPHSHSHSNEQKSASTHRTSAPAGATMTLASETAAGVVTADTMRAPTASATAGEADVSGTATAAATPLYTGAAASFGMETGIICPAKYMWSVVWQELLP
ncbi:hypothetical protein IWZ03DRAFT_430545 [Phyllosticta citriasiana]|uniref:Uncharacterized protein n=1 Tax=Phyllosticta citriasiana TaxID=595635 RepID=A0ABR1KIK0_9PEZI